MFDPANRAQFLNLAALFEGGMVGVAIVAGWMLGLEPLKLVRWNTDALSWGVLATLPLVTLFLVSMRIRFAPLVRIEKLLVEMLGPSLAACRPLDLVFLAMLAGFGEELLFRGVVQPWFEQFGAAAGLIGSNVIFGLAHAVTPTYAILAAAIGAYLGVVLDISGERNVLAPAVTHALYDYIAFLVVLRLYRERKEHTAGSFDDSNWPGMG